MSQKLKSDLQRCAHDAEEIRKQKKRKSGEGAVAAPEIQPKKEMDEMGRSALMGAILLEVCKESSSDGFGSWEASNQKQSRVKWGSAEKPQREEWVSVLQRFHTDGCVAALEVQCPAGAGNPLPSKKPQVRKSGGGQAVGEKEQMTEMCRPPHSETEVTFVKHAGTGAKVFPKFKLKQTSEWPQKEWLTGVILKIQDREKWRQASNSFFAAVVFGNP